MSGTGEGVGRGPTLAEVFVIPATYDLAYSLWAHSGFFVKFFSSGQRLTALLHVTGRVEMPNRAAAPPVLLYGVVVSPPDPFNLVGTSG